MTDDDPVDRFREMVEASPITNPRLARANNERLLAEVEDLLRTMPSRDIFVALVHRDETIPWLGRTAAAIERWGIAKVPASQAAIRNLQSPTAQYDDAAGLTTLSTMLHQARAYLRMELGQVSVVVPQGQIFDYFEEVRKVIETARADLFFVDPYLDAEFVSRYLPHAAKGCPIRLLGGPQKIATLLSAVDLFSRQYATSVSVRVSTTIHDRYVFVDRNACYQSGASFKDGAKNAPAVLTRITDAFQAMWDTYEQLWGVAKVER